MKTHVFPKQLWTLLRYCGYPVPAVVLDSWLQRDLRRIESWALGLVHTRQGGGRYAVRICPTRLLNYLEARRRQIPQISPPPLPPRKYLITEWEHGCKLPKESA